MKNVKLPMVLILSLGSTLALASHGLNSGARLSMIELEGGLSTSGFGAYFEGDINSFFKAGLSVDRWSLGIEGVSISDNVISGFGKLTPLQSNIFQPYALFGLAKHNISVSSNGFGESTSINEDGMDIGVGGNYPINQKFSMNADYTIRQVGATSYSAISLGAFQKF